ncbi:MAG: alkaline phosphatase family protein [Planctomycetota bacterium]|jgi:hypothetical protein
MRTATVLLAVLALVGAVRAEEPAPESRNVILFGWDGAQREHVTQALIRGDLPTLQGIAKSGAWVEIEIEGATDTKAGWAQILTGYKPEVTGVFSNRKYQPIPKGLTIFERLPKGYATLAVIGKKGHVDADGPRKERLEGKVKRGRRAADTKIIEENGVKYIVAPGKPYFHTRKAMDLFENGLKHDEVVGRRAMELLREHKERPFFLFVHFAEVDSSGHRFGENSPEYRQALISNDYWTGRILTTLKELGLTQRTLIYVTADHGFDENLKGHRAAPHVFLATNDKRVCRGGRRQDVPATIYDALGLDPKAFDPPLDGTSLCKQLRQPRKKKARKKKAAGP